MPNASPSWEWVDLLGLEKPNYTRIWELQKERVDAVAVGAAAEAVFLCEHELVATMGRRARPENLVNLETPTFEIERGGDVTLHHPGQLVVYPILKLHGELFSSGLHEYLRFCEEAVIATLSRFGIAAGRFGPTGVWVRSTDGIKKIASLGIAVRRWVTYHGISMNVANDLGDFARIRPCDFDASVMTSMKKEGVATDVISVARVFREVFTSQLELLGPARDHHPPGNRPHQVPKLQTG